MAKTGAWPARPTLSDFWHRDSCKGPYDFGELEGVVRTAPSPIDGGSGFDTILCCDQPPFSLPYTPSFGSGGVSRAISGPICLDGTGVHLVSTAGVGLSEAVLESLFRRYISRSPEANGHHSGFV